MNLLAQLQAISAAPPARKVPANMAAVHAAWRMHPARDIGPLMRNRGWVACSDLARALGRDPSSVRLSLMKLIALGLVERAKIGHSAEAWRKKVYLYRWLSAQDVVAGGQECR